MIPIVANDFTQILDEGIGAVTNLGRAELVSNLPWTHWLLQKTAVKLEQQTVTVLW